MPETPPTVVVADPHPVVREGLPLLLRPEALHVVATAATASTAETLAVRHDPDVVLLSNKLPDGAGSAPVASLVRAGVRAGVVLYVDGDESDTSTEALRSGAAGVVSTARPVAQI